MITKEIIKEIHDNAVKKGFWELEKDKKLLDSFDRTTALIITEISEGVEALRVGKRANLKAYDDSDKSSESFEKYIKDSFEDEMADTVIRICDCLGAYSEIAKDKKEKVIDDVIRVAIEQYEEVVKVEIKEPSIFRNLNLCTSYLVRHIIKNEFSFNNYKDALTTLYLIAFDGKFNLDYHIKEKMEYNSKRSAKHGKLF